MSASNQGRTKQTFLQMAQSQFRANIRAAFGRASAYRKQASETVNRILGNFHEFMVEHKTPVIVCLALACWLGLTIWFLVDWKHGKVEGDAVKTGVGGIFGGLVMGMIAGPILAIAAYITVLAGNGIVKLLSPVVLYLPVLLWMPFYGLWQLLIVLGKYLLLIPLALLVLVSRSVQAMKGIFHTCPNSRCAYRGLPVYECSHCGATNPELWPNLYGLFKHSCIQCGTLLPTMNILGRDNLSRRCGNPDCGVPLSGKHAGKARERLVAIVGGVASGKTNYLLMAVDAIISTNSKDTKNLVGIIDDPGQEGQFREEFGYLAKGIAAEKTAEVTSAFLLYIRRPRKFQLYLYDAPGEEFATIGGMTDQKYLPLLEGVALLVDPMSFAVVRSAIGADQVDVPKLKETVDSLLVNAMNAFQVAGGRKIPLRLAVVISKADLDPVVEAVGDIRRESVSSADCRQAICDWGGEREIFKIEQRFQQVKYFACSALGREADRQNNTSFQRAGVLEPIQWILS